MPHIEDVLKQLKTFEVQHLDECAVGFKSKRDHNEITFGTTASFGINGTDKFGIVIWADRDDMRSAIDEILAKARDK